MKSRSVRYNISNLASWWGDKTLTDITTANCRAYAVTKTPAAGRADLEKLASAVRHWHSEYGPLQTVPLIWKPPRGAARDRWLTRSEAARFLRASRQTEHLKRFIMLGLYTGSRTGVLVALEWSWIDFKAGTMSRRAPGAAETKNKRTPPIRIRGSCCISYVAGTLLTPATPGMSFIIMVPASSGIFIRPGSGHELVQGYRGCIRMFCDTHEQPGWCRKA